MDYYFSLCRWMSRGGGETWEKKRKENAPFQKKKAVVLCVYKFALQRRD